VARSKRTASLPTANLPHPQIKHLIVLMLENRSFDHMLGYSRIPGVDGVWDKPEFKTSDDAHLGGLQDPGHDIQDVKIQLYGAQARRDKEPWAREPEMTGFIDSYKSYDSERAGDVKKCFSPERVPVLTSLAANFAVCNRWYSSIPGPTLPNRRFAHAGTSNGRLDMSADALDITTTIYDVLDDANVPSTIYADSWTGTATFRKLLDHQDQFFGTLDDFYQDCYDNNLPSYCFIEPRYSSGVVDGTFRPQNDQHPDSDIAEGEQLIYSIYKAIRSNRDVWKSSIFVVTYDEHGGIFDHVKPPVAKPPRAGQAYADDANTFGFNRYGVRVPAVIVSAYTKHVVLPDEFDHTSLIATARKLFTGQYQDNKLGDRAMAANTFDDQVLNRTDYRTDHIESTTIGGSRLDFAPPPVYRGEADQKSLAKCLNNLQIQHLQQALQLNDKLDKSVRVPVSSSLSQKVQEGAWCSIQAQEAEHFIQNVMTTIRHTGYLRPKQEDAQPVQPGAKPPQEKPE
jgi:phospholipase C